MQIGILGGTFNPVHSGHLAIAQNVLEEFCLDKVVFVPSCSPPHKKSPDIAPAGERFKMCTLAIQNQKAFTVSSLELERGGRSYSIETIKEFHNLYGRESKLYFIIGLDAALDIATWKKSEELLRSCEFIVVPRPGFDAAGISKKFSEKIKLARTPGPDISSADIRGRLKKGGSINNLVPPEIEAYIRQKKLYL